MDWGAPEGGTNAEINGIARGAGAQLSSLQPAPKYVVPVPRGPLTAKSSAVLAPVPTPLVMLAVLLSISCATTEQGDPQSQRADGNGAVRAVKSANLRSLATFYSLRRLDSSERARRDRRVGSGRARHAFLRDESMSAKSPPNMVGDDGVPAR